MAISLSAPNATELKPRICVFGVGGGGCNAVNNMITAGLEGVEFIVANTDAQQLAYAKTDRRIQLGTRVTEGLGAGAHPEIGMKAAEESLDEINAHLDGAHMVFITAGMGGGTGTGAAPVIARAARERGILTVGVVTKPFHFEQRHRMRLAEAGIGDLQRDVDTLIVIPNQNLFRIANEKTTFAEAFSMADRVLHSGVRSITDLMVMPGLINLDFADVRTVMSEMGKAMMGTGEAGGEDRALVAAQNAIANPLLDEVSLKGAKAVLVNVTGSFDMTLLEVDEAANAITAEVDPDANIIFGAAFDPSLEGKMRVSVVATGMEDAASSLPEPRINTRPAASRPPEIRTLAPGPTPIPAPAPEPVRMPEPAFRAPEPVRAPEPAPEPFWPAAARSPEPETAPEPIWEEKPAVAARAEPEAPTRDSDSYRSAAASPSDAFVDSFRPAAARAPAEPAPPLFAEPRFEEKKKGGFLSLFGGKARQSYAEPEPAYRAPVAPAGPTRGATALQPTQQVAEEPQADADDLDIPSFLRRLAN